MRKLIISMFISVSTFSLACVPQAYIPEIFKAKVQNNPRVGTIPDVITRTEFSMINGQRTLTRHYTRFNYVPVRQYLYYKSLTTSQRLSWSGEFELVEWCLN